MKTAEYWIEKLELEPHPEGGFFREVFRSTGKITKESLPAKFSGDRVYYTSIYFLLKGENFSAFHRIKSDEIWHFYNGASVRIHVLNAEGKYLEVKLGRDLENGELPQIMVAGGDWFGAEVTDKNSYALVGCNVAPGFEFEDFELGGKGELVTEYPEMKELIERLCIKE